MTLLIVDDHPPFRRIAATLLGRGGFVVLAEAGDAEAALAAARRVRPEVVLLDVQLPGADGFAVAGALAKEPDPPVIVLTSSREAADYRDRLRASPAHGFILKSDLTATALSELVGRET